jgi:hypothetical protein
MELVRLLMTCHWGECCRVEVTNCSASGAGAAQQKALEAVDKSEKGVGATGCCNEEELAR